MDVLNFVSDGNPLASDLIQSSECRRLLFGYMRGRLLPTDLNEVTTVVGVVSMGFVKRCFSFFFRFL